MDKITISHLKLEMLIGCLPWERSVKQPIYLDITFSTDCRAIAETDALTDAVSYVDVKACLEEWAQQNSPQLVETAIEQIASHLIATFSFSYIKLVLHKKQALSDTSGISVTIERSHD